MTTALQRFVAAPLLTVDLAGTQVAYRRFGNGPAVVLVHGWPFSGVTYRGLVQALSSDFTCYVLDLPGAGDSPWDPATNAFFADFGALVHRFVDALGLTQFALVGHDSGGAIARIAASRMPGRVTALALTNTETPGHRPLLVRGLQLAASLPGAAAIFRALLGSRTFRRSALGFGGLFEDLALLDGDFHEAMVQPLRRNVAGPLAALRHADFGIVDQLDAVHAKIDAPVLCVWGDRDPFFPLAAARAMVDTWPGDARLEVIPGKKLLVHEEACTRVASLFGQFIGEHAHGHARRHRPSPA